MDVSEWPPFDPDENGLVPVGTADFRTIIEGICPYCLSALSPRGSRGWCDGCGIGWSWHNGTVAAYFEKPPGGFRPWSELGEPS